MTKEGVDSRRYGQGHRVEQEYIATIEAGRIQLKIKTMAILAEARGVEASGIIEEG